MEAGNSMLPQRYSPAGTRTSPPPAARRRRGLLEAAVSLVTPLPVAPKLRTLRTGAEGSRGRQQGGESKEEAGKRREGHGRGGGRAGRFLPEKAMWDPGRQTEGVRWINCCGQFDERVDSRPTMKPHDWFSAPRQSVAG